MGRSVASSGPLNGEVEIASCRSRRGAVPAHMPACDLALRRWRSEVRPTVAATSRNSVGAPRRAYIHEQERRHNLTAQVAGTCQQPVARRTGKSHVARRTSN